MHSANADKIIIEGMTVDGRKFRPSDWAERMSGSLSSFGQDHRIHYSPMMQPMTINGIKCITIDPQLKQANPAFYNYIMEFAKANQLVVSGLPEENE